MTESLSNISKEHNTGSPEFSQFFRPLKTIHVSETVNPLRTKKDFIRKKTPEDAKNRGVMDYGGSFFIYLNGEPINFRLGGNFITWFLGDDGKIEEPAQAAEFDSYEVRRVVSDDMVFKKRGKEKKSAISLAAILSMVKKQPKGEKGDLHNDSSFDNFFFVYDKDNQLRSLICMWTGQCWALGAAPVNGSSKLSAG